MAHRREPSRRGRGADPLISTRSDRTTAGWFIAWMLVGAGYAFGVLSLLSIGIFVVAIAAVATIFLARRTHSHTGLPGLVGGLSLPLFYLAFLNRSGPGMICTTTATSETCVQETSPWPWVVIGIALLVSGCVWFTRANRRRRSVRTSS